MFVRFVNLTDTTTYLPRRDWRGDVINFLAVEPSGKVAKTAKTSRVLCSVDDVRVYCDVYSPIVNLPESAPGIVYIVDEDVFYAASGRNDVVYVVKKDPDASDTAWTRPTFAASAP